MDANGILRTIGIIFSAITLFIIESVPKEYKTMTIIIVFIIALIIIACKKPLTNLIMKTQDKNKK